jgi:RNA polymerase sigma factor (sigma-70 family)
MDVSSKKLENERELLIRVSKDDQTAFTLLFDHYQSKIYSVALNLTRSQELAEDLVQNIFMACWLRRTKLPDVHRFDSYLFIMARNAAITSLKKIAGHESRLREFPEDIVEVPGSFVNSDVPDYSGILYRAVEQLPEQQKKVFILIKEQGLSREAAARTLGISPNTVKIHLGRAVRTVKALCHSYMKLLDTVIHLTPAATLYFIHDGTHGFIHFI